MKLLKPVDSVHVGKSIICYQIALLESNPWETHKMRVTHAKSIPQALVLLLKKKAHVDAFSNVCDTISMQ